MSKTHRPQPTNQVRIIGGQWRGRKLHFPNLEGLRPTTDRVRETVFNWLAGDIVGAKCLDVFTGSGALGFESLSRGAKYCCFIDENVLVTRQILSNCKALECLVRAEVITADACEPITLPHTFDVVFLDPPFNTAMLNTSLQWLLQSPLIDNETLFYIETRKSEPFDEKHLEIIKQKNAGDVCFRLAQRR